MSKPVTSAAILLILIATGTGSVPANSDSSSKKIKKALEKFERTGESRRCLSRHTISSIRAVDDRHLIIRVSPKISYLSRLPHRCFGLRFNEGIAYKPLVGQICRADTFKVLDGNGSFGAFCGFGSFEKLHRKPRKRDS